MVANGWNRPNFGEPAHALETSAGVSRPEKGADGGPVTKTALADGRLPCTAHCTSLPLASPPPATGLVERPAASSVSRVVWLAPAGGGLSTPHAVVFRPHLTALAGCHLDEHPGCFPTPDYPPPPAPFPLGSVACVVHRTPGGRALHHPNFRLEPRRVFPR